MNRKFKKIVANILLVFVLAISAPWLVMETLAASVRISFSDPTVTVESETTVTVKITSTSGETLGKADVMLSYDSNMLEFIDGGSSASGGAGSIRLQSAADTESSTVFAHTLKFKALQAGTTKITVASQEVYDSNSSSANVNKIGESTVTIQAKSTASKEAALSSLKVSPGTLTPEFSSEVTEYTVDVGTEVTKLAVSAVAKDSTANIVTTGSSDLQMGANTVVCKVTAQDGQTVKKYTITANRVEGGAAAGSTVEGSAGVDAETGDLTEVIGDVTYEIATSFDASALPEGFESQQITFRGKEIQAGKELQKNLTLLYLVNGEGNGGFFIYDEVSNAISPWVEVMVAAKSVIILPFDENIDVPEGFGEATISIDQNKVKGWVWKSDEEKKYCVFYGMNWNGEKGLYRYDFDEKTMQRYFQDPAADTGVTVDEHRIVVENYNSLFADYELRGWIIIGMGALTVLLVVIIIFLIATRTGGNPKASVRERQRESGQSDPEFAEDDYDRSGRSRPVVKKVEEQYLMDDVERVLEDNLAEEAGDLEDITDLDDDDDDFELIDLDK